MKFAPHHEAFDAVYSESTNAIKVTVLPAYMEEASSPYDNHYVWSYTIYIENSNSNTVQLLSRHWQVIDENGCKQEVKGVGVIGKQPILIPQEIFEYSSQVHLSSPSGVMMGSYQMIFSETGEKFDIAIPAFSLDSPDLQVILN